MNKDFENWWEDNGHAVTHNMSSDERTKKIAQRAFVSGLKSKAVDEDVVNVLRRLGNLNAQVVLQNGFDTPYSETLKDAMSLILKIADTDHVVTGSRDEAGRAIELDCPLCGDPLQAVDHEFSSADWACSGQP